MCVFRRKTTAGLTKEYHYRFQQGGRDYHGVCEGCFTEADALRYEERLRDLAKRLSQQKSVKAIVENFKLDLAGADAVALDSSFNEYAKRRGRNLSPTELRTKRSEWQDFVFYINDTCPEARYLHQVTPRMAEEYIAALRADGRHTKPRRQSSASHLSASTLNRYLKHLREIFGVVGDGENPFAKIAPVRMDCAERLPFTLEELEAVMHCGDAFVTDLFTLGLLTAMREGDLATLRWDEVDLNRGVIHRRQRKTGRVVDIPILPQLKAFLLAKQVDGGEYVLPEHAQMYRTSQTSISRRVRKCLERLGIKTTAKVAGRDRAVSVKDVHSLRHTFCYFAGLAGIPLVVVQSIVGHLTQEMTAHYSAHADIEAKQTAMKLLPEMPMPSS